MKQTASQVESKRQDFVSALKETDEIDLTVAGRTSGRKTTRPVWFVQEGNKLYLLPVTGSDSEWYKNVLKNPTVALTVNGVTYTAKASPITDPAKVRTVVEKFRAKYRPGEIKKYYSKLDVAVEVPLGKTGLPGQKSGRKPSSKARRG
jgi:deazaflavin-dependent oxidoreductase (nitroreductase family)